MAEIELSILSRRYRSDYFEIPVPLAEVIAAREGLRNNVKAGINCRFTAIDARNKLETLPNIIEGTEVVVMSQIIC